MEKKKLTKEELMAGKCLPDEDDFAPRDPRFKSPDEILLQMMASKRAAGTVRDQRNAVTIEHGYMNENDLPPLDQNDLNPGVVIERKQPVEPFTVKEPAHPTLEKELLTLKEKYAEDRRRWKDYENKVIQWKEQVMDVIRNMEAEAGDVEMLRKEIETLKEMNRKKDKEIETLANNLPASNNK